MFCYTNGENIRIYEKVFLLLTKVSFQPLLWTNLRIIPMMGRPMTPASQGSICSVLLNSNVAPYYNTLNIFWCLLHGPFFPLAVLHGLQGLSSTIRDWIWFHGLNHWTTRESALSTLWVTDSVVTYPITFNLSSMQSSCCYPHYTDGKTEVQST